MNNREKFWQSEKSITQSTREEIAQAISERINENDPQEIEKLPIGLERTQDLVIGYREPMETIYSWYHDAMIRRDREPLEEGRFIDHFFEGMSTNETVAFGDWDKGYLLGFYKHGVFIPTHFAPKTLRGGYELVQNLGESTEIPSVISITSDLTSTIEKIPSWHILDMSFLSPFRNALVEKNIAYNEHPEVRERMQDLLNDYLKEGNVQVAEDAYESL